MQISKKTAVLLFVFIVSACLAAQCCAQRIYELVDTPTADALDNYGYNLSFRFYTGGGVLTKAAFGVLQRINIGFSWDLDNVVGSEKIDVQQPALNAKLRIFDGDMFVPAFALGYDGQGYGYDKQEKEYTQREKGVYLVATNEIFVPGLQYNIGGYIYDFDDDVIFGFCGLSMSLGNSIALIAEYDNIRKRKENRFNGGLRLYVTPTILVDLVGRDMGSSGRDAERIIRVSYIGIF